MSIDLGLEYLQINKPSGSLFEAYNDYLIAYEDVIDASDSLNKALEAFGNLYNLKRAINKYGRTRSLEALVGAEAMYSCENIFVDAWNAIKKFFKKLWDKIKSWFGKLTNSSNSLKERLKKIKEKYYSDRGNNYSIKCKTLVKEYIEKVASVFDGNISGSWDSNYEINFFTRLDKKDFMADVSKEFKNPNNKLFDKDITAYITDYENYKGEKILDTSISRIDGYHISNFAENMIAIMDDIPIFIKNLNTSFKTIGDELEKQSKDPSQDQAKVASARARLTEFNKLIRILAEANNMNLKVFRSFVSGVSSAEAK